MPIVIWKNSLITGHQKLERIRNKPLISYQLTLVTLDASMKSKTTTAGGNMGKGSFILCWWKCYITQYFWKNGHFSKKLRIEISYNSVVSLIGLYYWPKILKKLRHLYCYVHCNIIHNSQNRKQHIQKHDWIKKLWYIY